MSEAWNILTTANGEDIDSPSKKKLKKAIDEVFFGVFADDAEHGSTSLRYSFDDGPVYAVDMSNSRLACFEKWANADFEEELAPSKTISVTAEQALQIWLSLKAGEIDDVRIYFAIPS